MNTHQRPFNWEDDAEQAEEPVAQVSRVRLAQLDNGTRPLVVHVHSACMN